MEEHKDEEVSEPSTVSGTEHVDAAGVSESIKVSEAAVSEGQLLGQAEESTKEAIAEVSESCNGLDVVVGVMGSDMGDGVSVQQSGDQVGEGSSSKEEGSEREVKNLEVAGSETEVGCSSVVVESKEEKLVEGGEDSKEANCPVGDRGDSETKSEVGGPSVVMESKEEELVTATEVSMEVDGGVGAINDLETQNDVDDLSTAAGSKEGKSVSGGAEGLFTPAGSKEGNSVEGTEGTEVANDDAGADNELRTENEVRSPPVVAESKEGNLLAVGEGGKEAGSDVAAAGDGVDDKSPQGIGDAPRMGIGIGVVDSSPIESSKETQTVVREMVGEEELAKDGGERDDISMSEDVSSRKVGTSVDEAPDLNAEIGTGSTSVAAGSSVLGTQDGAEKSELVVASVKLAEETYDSGGEALQVLETKQVDALHNKVLNPGTETAAVTTSTIMKSSEVGAVVMTGNEGLDPMVLDEETDGSRGDASPGSEKKEIDVLHEKLKSPGAETVSITSSTIIEDSSSDTKDVSEGAVALTGHEALDPMVLDEETNGSGGDALQGSGNKEVDVLHNESQNPATETAFITSSTIIKDFTPASKVVEGGAIMMAGDEGLNPRVEGPGINASETPGGVASERIISSSDGDSTSTEKDEISEKTSNSLGDQTRVAGEGKVASIDDEDIACPNIEGMDSDAFNENFCFSVEELQATVETANGSTENHFGAFADPQSFYQPTQVVVGVEAASKQDKEHFSSSDTQKVTVGECLDQGVAGDSAQVHSTIEAVMVVSKQGTCVLQACIQKEQGPEQLEKVEAKSWKAENICNVSLDSVTSSQSSKAILFDKADGSQLLKAGTVIGEREGEIQAAFVNNGTTLTPDVEVLEQSEKDDQVTHAKQHLGEEKKVDGVHSAVEAVHVSSGTDTQVMDGKEHVTSNARALNPKAAFEMPSDNNQQLEVRGSLDKSTASDLAEIDSSIGQEIIVEEHVDLHVWKEMEVEQGTGAEQCRNTAHESVKWEALMLGSSEKTHQANYQLPPDNEVEFSVSDLVWGKVRSHPWWPGQIFDHSDASEKAMKYYKKDCFLVAYFGDRTFAWNEASLLKPFRSHFSEVEKLSTSETFQNAVDCALEEVSRRFELGLACSCISEDTYDNIKLQIVENTGIRQESSTRAGLGQSTNVDLFEPNKLVEYVKELAQSPVGGADRLQLVIAKSQLLAFYRLKGYYQLPDILFSGELLENADALQFEESVCEDAYPAYVGDGQSSVCQGNLQTQSRSYNKRKHNLKDSFYPRKKERNLPEIMGDSWDSVDDEIGSNGKGQLLSPSSDGKQKGGDSFADDLSAPEGRKTISFAKVSTPRPSFKIGDCIRRVASQMTGSPSILKGSSQKPDVGSDGLIGDAPDTSFQQCEDAEMKRTVVPAESLPLEELLSQLQFAARDPLKGYNFFSIIITFFSDFRNSVVIDQHDKVGGKRRKVSQSLGSPETFEFEDMNDTYWRDRFIENGSEEQPSRKSRKRDNHFVPVILDKPLGRSNSRKRYSDTSYDVAEQKPVGYVDEKAPAELVMHFPVVESVPSEINLNKMFKSFGPLRESETEVDRDTNRARVVFKRCSDAEVAYSSAPRFSIFGSTLVNYQLNYVISVPFKTPPIAIAHEEDDPTLFLQY